MAIKERTQGIKRIYACKWTRGMEMSMEEAIERNIIVIEKPRKLTIEERTFKFIHYIIKFLERVSSNLLVRNIEATQELGNNLKREIKDIVKT